MSQPEQFDILILGSGKSGDLIDSITAGLRSACTYAGAGDLDELHQRAVVGVQGAAGYTEGMPSPTSW